MSKLSVHNTGPTGDTTGFASFLKKCHTAGSPVPIIYALNRNVMSDVVTNSPSTQVVYRRQTDTFNRLPDNFFNDDPVASATNWMTVTKDKSDQNRTLIQNWKLNPADYYDPLNEPALGEYDANPDEFIRRCTYLNTWMITALNIAHQSEMKLAMFSFPTGSPDVHASPYLLPCLRLGKQLGAIISLHAYWEGDATQEIGNVMRFKDFYDSLPTDAQMPIFYSEASPGNGYNTGLSGQAWIDAMEKLDQAIAPYPYMIGACGFQLGGAESNLQPALASYGDYIATHPIINPPAESEDGTTIPPALQIVDSSNHIWTLGADAPHGHILLKDGTQFAGGQGVLLLYDNRKVYAQNDLNEWYMASDTTWIKVSGDPRPTTKVSGIDVSFYQGWIDWTKVKASGIQFAFIKATQGATITDSRFSDNWKASKIAGIPRGAYHYYTFNSYWNSQYTRLTSALSSMSDKGELPIAVDVEDEHFVSIYSYPEQLAAFLSKVSQYGGRKVIVYTAKWWLNQHPQYLPVMSKYDLWCADYAHTSPALPTGFTTWKFWQYSSTGKVNGITGNVDLDVFNGNQEQFNAYLNIINPSPPPTNTTLKAGLHMAARGGDQTSQDWQAFDTAKLKAIKFLSNHAYNDIVAGVQRVGASNVYFRMYADPNDANAMSSGTNFFNVHRGWLDQLYAIGVYNYEVANEPNLESENPNNAYWQGASGFSAWYRQCARLIRQYYPKARIIYPGLSPQPDVVPYWKSEIQKLINEGLVDLIGTHSYWQTSGTESWGMLALDGGQYYQNFLGMGRNLVITEASNNSQSIDKTTKGNQYVQYLNTIKPGVDAVLFFVSSTANPAYNAESWAGSQIPSIVGAR